MTYTALPFVICQEESFFYELSIAGHNVTDIDNVFSSDQMEFDLEIFGSDLARFRWNQLLRPDNPGNMYRVELQVQGELRWHQRVTEEIFSSSYFLMQKPSTVLDLIISHEDIITRVIVSDSEVYSEWKDGAFISPLECTYDCLYSVCCLHASTASCVFPIYSHMVC